MNYFRVAALTFAALCIVAAIVIGYRKWWVPFSDERSWRRDNAHAIKQMEKHAAAIRQRQANVKNGRTQRIVPIERKTGR